MHIHLRERRISFDGATLKTRSKELMRFVGYLAWRFQAGNAPAWVGMEEMRGVVGTAHPRQYQRYLDALEDAKLPVVEFKTKTGGPWRLSGKVKRVIFDLPGAEIAQLFAIRPPRVSDQADDEWLFALVKQLTEADSFFHDGNLSDSLLVTQTMLADQNGFDGDVELQIMLHLRIARTCTRATLFEEALAALDTAARMLKRCGVSSPDLNIRILLAKSKLLYDRGRFAQAAAVLESLAMQECRDTQLLAQYHNLAGLFIHRRLRMGMRTKAGARRDPAMAWEQARDSVAHYRRSLVSHLLLNDYHGVQAVCFNLGNLFAFSVKQGLQTENAGLLESAIRWLALSETISNKLGVGGESVWALYVMLDTAVAENLALDRLKSLTGKLFNRFDSFEAAAEDISLEAQRIGNRPEMAECLQLQCRLAMRRGDAARAREYAQGALDLFSELKRADMIRPLKKLITKLGDKNEEKVKNAA